MVCRSNFGTDEQGKSLWLFQLTNGKGMSVTISNYGAAVIALNVPDRNGRIDDIVLGFDDLEQYRRHSATYFGAIVGRYANRLGGSSFSLNGVTYKVDANEGVNSLHGGKRGFDKCTWNVVNWHEHSSMLHLSYVSADGEQGYPGELTVHTVYTLTEENELRIEFKAQSTADTVVNLTDHSDFHLDGAGNGDVLDHWLWIAADTYLPVLAGLIPTGEQRSVLATPYDFRAPQTIGSRIAESDAQLQIARGYDHTFVLNNWDSSLRMAARVYAPRSGRMLELFTTQPGMHFYSGNFLDGSVIGKRQRVYGFRGAFYLGAQHFPDSPHHAGFPSTVLRTGQTFSAVNLYRFSTASTLEEFQRRCIKNNGL